MMEKAVRAVTTAFILSLTVGLISIDSSSVALGQGLIDPSSALLLNSPASGSVSSSTESDSRLDSGRYTVRPRSERTQERPSAAVKKQTDEKPVVKKELKAEEKTVVLVPAADGVVTVPLSTESAAVSSKDSGPAESKSRILELTVASGYFYESAESGYSFRNGYMTGPAYSVGVKAWLSPEFGIGGNYFSSLGGQVADGVSAVSASRTEAVLGFYIRSLFSNSDLSFGVEYTQNEFKVAGETVSRLGTRTRGLRLNIEAQFAKSLQAVSSVGSSWVLGFSAAPKVQHEEVPAATNVQSGTAVNAYQVGVSVERRWRFDFSNMIFLKLEHRIERDLFTGSVSQADRIGGATPNGVSATVGTTVIQFGYGWGG